MGEEIVNLIPKSTQDYLDYGASKGNRNNALLNAACQLRDARFSQDEAIRILVQRASSDGLSEVESLATIRSAFSRSPREACVGNFASAVHMNNGGHDKKTAYRKISVETENLPPPVDNGAIAFIETKFRPHEFVAIGYGYEMKNKSGELSMAISKGDVRTRETWISDIQLRGLDAVLPYVDGVFVRVNPMVNANGSSDKDVAVYRDVLVESDEGTLEYQFAAIRSIGLPISTVAYSAGRSVQAHVRIDATDEQTYRERFSILRQFCVESLGLKMDEKNINPSRYSRLPGGKRTRRDHDTCEKSLDPSGHHIIDDQTLLAVNLEGKAWDEWVDDLPIDDGAEVISVSQLRAFERDNDPDSMFGEHRWAGRDTSVVLQGPSGIGKSSFLMQWIICAALGRTLLDIPCFKPKDGKAKRAMLIQAENDKGDLAEAFQDITDKMMLSEADFTQIQDNVVFLRQDNKSGRDFIEFVRQRVKRHRPDIVFGDPLLAYIGGDILKQDVTSQFLRNWLNPIIREFGLLWIWAQHTGKPRHDVEKTHEEKKYAGLSSSELTNWAREIITMSELSDGMFELSFGKRWRRTGILNAEGWPVKTINIQQSDCGTVWESVQGPPIEGGSKGMQMLKDKKKVLAHIIEQKIVTRSQLKIWASNNGMPQNTAVTIAKALVDDAFEPRIYCYRAHGGGKANTNKGDIYTTIPPKI
jgi:RecA-family ATPase